MPHELICFKMPNTMFSYRSFSEISLPFLLNLLFYLVSPAVHGQIISPATAPTDAIRQWEKLQFGMFIHFGMNTFDDGSDYDDWKSPSTKYNPTRLNVRQWIQTAKQAGMQYAVLTVKHSSGFCLWDSEEYDYDVAASSNPTDVVAEFMKACQEEGIRPGFYYCVLDAYQNNGWSQLISDRYYQQILKHLTELHTRYPVVTEQWIDIPGNCTQSQREGIYQVIKKLSPNCLVLLNQGLDVSKKNQGTRVEPGCWPTDIINGEFYLPPSTGHQPLMTIEGRSYYIPMEVCDNGGDNSNNADGSSAGNWFYTNRYKLRSVGELYKLYQACRQRRSNLLLNIPPTAEGIVSDDIVVQLKALKAQIDQASNK